MFTYLHSLLNIHRSGALTALFGCYLAGATVVKLLSSPSMFCVHHATIHHNMVMDIVIMSIMFGY